jgi:hypothetical protein
MDEPDGWGGRILLTVREPDGAHRSLVRDFRAREVRFDTTSPDLGFGTDSYVRLEGDRYRVVARGVEGASIDVMVAPVSHRYFPPTDLGGQTLVSGYTVPALYARAEGTVCLPSCEQVTGVQAYHDHNWGVWRDVSWEWGTASDEKLSLLYGVVRGDTAAAHPGLFVYLVDNEGPIGIYRPRDLTVPQLQDATIGGRTVRVPKRMAFAEARQALEVEIDVGAVHLTDMERPRRRYFVQMRGTARVRLDGREIGVLPGFFETYVD